MVGTLPPQANDGFEFDAVGQSVQRAWDRYAASEQLGDVEVERRDEGAVPGFGKFYGDRLTNSSISTSSLSRLQDTTEVDLRATFVGRAVAFPATKLCSLRSQNL